MRIHIKYPLWLSIISALLLFSIGCATKPNPLYRGPLPDKFNTIAQRNPLLAKELRKLPEFQDGISEKEAAALEEWIEFYDSNPSAFDKAFKKMYQVGLPDVRKYNSPLQALFWLIEDGKLSEESAPLGDYSLEKLLKEAWVFKVSYVLPIHVANKISQEDVDRIVAGIKSEDEKKYFQNLRESKFNIYSPGIKSFLSNLYRENPHQFSDESKRILDELFADYLDYLRHEEEKVKRRWKDFDTVTDRLNAPELIDYYTKKNFTYDEYKGDMVSDQRVFKSKKANCYDTSQFIAYSLQKSGYPTSLLWVESHTDIGHIIVSFKNKGEKFLIDNGTVYPKGIIGPYQSLRETGYTIQGDLR